MGQSSVKQFALEAVQQLPMARVADVVSQCAATLSSLVTLKRKIRFYTEINT